MMIRLLPLTLLLLASVAQAQTYDEIRQEFPNAQLLVTQRGDVRVLESPRAGATTVGVYGRNQAFLAYKRTGDYWAVAIEGEGHKGYVEASVLVDESEFVAASALNTRAARNAAVPSTVILMQPDAPVRIESYDAGYKRNVGVSSRLTVTNTSGGIQHNVRYRNQSDRSIVAVEFGLLAFNAFNEYIGRVLGVDMREVARGRTRDGQWRMHRFGDFAFFTGVAYVNAVRFDDGRVWKADLVPILTQIREIEADFELARLKERDQSTDE
jgi:hypothetical protein